MTLDRKAHELYRYINLIKSRTVPDQLHLLESDCASLNLKEINVISTLGEYGSCKMKELAAFHRAAFSTMTGIVDRLVHLEYVARKRTTQDRRVVLVTLTEQGKNVYYWIQNQSIKLYELILGLLDEQEQQQCLDLARKITENITPVLQP